MLRASILNMRIVVDKYPESCLKCPFKRVTSNHLYGGNTEYYTCNCMPHAIKGSEFKYRRRDDCPLVEYNELKGD